MVSYDVSSNIAKIEYNGHDLKVSLRLLDSFPFLIGALFQFIGEINIDAQVMNTPHTTFSDDEREKESLFAKLLYSIDMIYFFPSYPHAYIKLMVYFLRVKRR